MRDAINELNKNSISKATGISYGRLRKYASGLIKDLTPEEQEKIYQYLINLANRFLMSSL
jgi:hypothetical protein